MSTNAEQSPRAGPVAAPGAGHGSVPRVDGNCLVVASRTVLPPVCVKTNQPVSEDDLVCRDLRWCSPWILLLILLSGLLLILVYFLARLFNLCWRVVSHYGI